MESVSNVVATKGVDGRWKHLKEKAVLGRVGDDMNFEKGTKRKADDSGSEEERVVYLSGRECDDDEEWTPTDTEEEPTLVRKSSFERELRDDARYVEPYAILWALERRQKRNIKLKNDSETVTLFCMCSLTALMVDEKKKSVHCMEILDYIYDLLESTVDEFPTTVRQLKQKTEAQWKRNIRTALRYHPGVFRIDSFKFRDARYFSISILPLAELVHAEFCPLTVDILTYLEEASLIGGKNGKDLSREAIRLEAHINRLVLKKPKMS
eukprot:CAMPEP_0113889598 /NCGR_PEP_ID=MMETSP0780_2-20120614/13602_1 /TAXON_ID=652834 /ORGANISM="Palpitomonas bilix" /LENGTH=266 /DNA_ID=CAMNT_0000878747 /DNA_START=259 /DNA_END=1059 /DNA_ORIENTATION=+ /assembly_acc=CAM_ASM_000599